MSNHLHEEEDLPNLNHWKSVMEFTVEQAALLMAMIDPLDVESSEEAKRLQIPRWKKAHGWSLAIISAIRQGLISPVVCRSCTWNEDSFGNTWYTKETIKPSDRNVDISPKDTVITRASLLNWISSENVQIVRPKPTRIIQPQPATIEVHPSEATSTLPAALPYHGHASEGLEFVEDAIYQFWTTVDEYDPTTVPTKKDVVDYLKKKGASQNVAQAVDLILRPENMRKAKLRNYKVVTRETQ